MTLEDKILAIVLAGGKGTRMYNLTKERAKPAVPFAGYRIIDIMLSNLIVPKNPNMKQIHILTEYKSDSLSDHIGRLHQKLGLDEFVRIIPTQQRELKEFTRGSGDSIYNTRFNRSQLPFDPDHYLVLSGDHITDIDLVALLKYHKRTGADLTITVKRLPVAEAEGMGIVVVDPEMNVIDFVEKPEIPPEIPGDPGYCLVNEAEYVYRPELLDDSSKRFLPPASEKRYDQSLHIVTPLVKEGKFKIKAFMHDGYWADVGTLDSLFKANMDMISPNPKFNLYHKERHYNSYVDKYQGVGPKISDTGVAKSGTILNNGTIISGIADRCVFSYGIETKPGSNLFEVVAFDECLFSKNSFAKHSIFDKETYVGEGAVVDPSRIDLFVVNGNVVGQNRNGYRIVPIGTDSDRAKWDHILVQKSLDNIDFEQILDEDGYIPQMEMRPPKGMRYGRFIEFVITPERKLAFSKYTNIPDGFII